MISEMYAPLLRPNHQRRHRHRRQPRDAQQRQQHIVEHEKLHHHRGAAEQPDVKAADRIQHARQPLVLRQHAHGRDHRADHDADEQAQHGDGQRVLQALEHLCGTRRRS